MTKASWTWALAAVVGGAVLAADGATAQVGAMPSTQPSATTRPAGKVGRHRKLPKPYADMKSLTPQQQEQILKIHEDALDQENKVREKEKDDVSALLTPEQQAELSDVQGKEKQDRKATPTRRKRGDAATTMPAK